MKKALPSELQKKITLIKIRVVKAYTDLEQSKKLAEILPTESADMWWAERYKGAVMPDGQYVVEENAIYYLSLTNPSNSNNSQDVIKAIPCWSLAALFEVLPKIYNCKPMIDLEEISIQYDGVDLYIIGEDLVDTCYEMILKLHESNKLVL